MSQVKTTKEAREEFKPYNAYELGDGLELWQVDLAAVHEQSVNARSMSSDAFNQLTDNVKRSGRLESLPFCAYTDKLELISGHHRTRAARKAGMTKIWCLVDVSGMTRSWVVSKQLSHNSIQGKDNPEIVAQLLQEIQDSDAVIEAFVESDLSELVTDTRLLTRELDVSFETKAVTLLFLPAQHKLFLQAMGSLVEEADDIFLATREEYDLLVDTVGEVSETYNIKSTPTLFATMAEIVLEHVEKKKKAAAEAEQMLAVDGD